MSKILTRTSVFWLPLIIAVTGVFGFAYVAVQQNYRQSMNDPQIDIAEHAASVLSQGGVLVDVVPRVVTPIDIRTSLDTWVTVYDASGTPLASSATLDGVPPRMPIGLLDTNTWVPHKTWHAPSGLETRVSWQPRDDVRQAVVLVHYDSAKGGGLPAQAGWVASGRSMRLVEERVINLTQLAAVAWSTTVLATFAAIFILLALGWL